jgi:dienelactone hydrolase
MATLTVSGKDQSGNTWVSKASYRADKTGAVDPARDSPIEGTYNGVDPSGLFWSMSCGPVAKTVPSFVVMRNLTVALLVDGQEITSKSVQRTPAVDLDREEVSGDISGVFLKPRELTEPSPALIVLGGSEGGFQESWASVFASKTRMPAMALGYFGERGLPPTLENIPLETIEKAMVWRGKQPGVEAGRIGVIGASRGGELAILSASVFPDIKAVVGYTPSGLVWEGVSENQTPAWTYRGKPFPYLLMLANKEAELAFMEAQLKGTPYLDAPIFEYSLKVQQDKIAAATIPVENSRAAFLLIGNPGDGVWPSQELSRVTIDRLRANRHPRPCELLSYENGGHMLVPYPYYPTTMRQFFLPTLGIWEGLGGTAEAAAHAAYDSWPRVISFLKRELMG